jgi:predicted dehydrogenase
MSVVSQAGGLRKLARFAAIYGPGRTLFKVAGRLRLRLPSWRIPSHRPDVGLIGCGQFAFATIGYVLHRRFGRRLLTCFDTNADASKSLARALDVRHVATSAESLLSESGLRVVYVASNHASHAAYAALALERGLDVYVEKPVAVDLEQLRRLETARRHSSGRLFAGYNRPFAAAIRELRRRMNVDLRAGITLQCTVIGHRLAPDHWYRRPEEGTRICGNVGHWLDLFVHVLHWRGLPQELDIALSWADATEPDDNLCIAMTSDRADLCSIVLSSRSEPFEGINETIELQHGTTICKIDDFRRMTLWQGERSVCRRYWPKDPGHQEAILQPFSATPSRAWDEVALSSLLMLHITAMVRARTRLSSFSFEAARDALRPRACQATST